MLYRTSINDRVVMIQKTISSISNFIKDLKSIEFDTMPKHKKDEISVKIQHALIQLDDAKQTLENLYA